MSDYYYTYSGDEETLKSLVARHGAVVTSVNADGPFMDYGGGVFAGCSSDQTNHAVTVVGYGNENGEDYWLVKNSWGEGNTEKFISNIMKEYKIVERVGRKWLHPHQAWRGYVRHRQEHGDPGLRGGGRAH